MTSPTKWTALLASIAAVICLAMAWVPIGNAAGSAELDALIKAAKLEGSISVEGPPDNVVRQALTAEFTKKYGIAVSYISGAGSKTGSRVRAERAAGRYLLDVLVTGADTPIRTFLPAGWLDPVEPVLVDPNVLDKTKWQGGHLWFVDPNHTILRTLAYINPTIAINTKVLKPGEVSTFADLIDSKWKGKMLLKDPAVAGPGASLISYFYMTFGPEYVEKLYRDQKPIMARDSRQAVQSLAQGSFPIWIGPDNHEVSRFKELGYPIEYLFPPDGPQILSGGWGFICLINKAPHPNAAKLFVNWFASKEGQEIFGKATTNASLRTDFAQDWVSDYAIPKEGGNYLDTYDYAFVTTQRDAAFDKAQKLLGF